MLLNLITPSICAKFSMVQGILVCILVGCTVAIQNDDDFLIAHSTSWESIGDSGNEEYEVLREDNEIRAGFYRRSDSIGNILELGNYELGLKHGLWQKFKNSLLAKVSLYNLGELIASEDLANGGEINLMGTTGFAEGLWLIEEDNRTQVGVYAAGRKEGFWYERALSKIYNHYQVNYGMYENDMRDGIWKVVYDEHNIDPFDGFSASKVSYNFVYEAGQLMAVPCCHNDSVDAGSLAKGNGTLKIYNHYGTLIEITSFRSGVRHGAMRFYRHFTDRTTTEEPFVILEQWFNEGNAEGKYILYQGVNLPLIEGQYLNNQPTGKWTVFDAEGNISQYITHPDSSQISELHAPL